MTRTLVLSGGAEFEEGTQPLDRAMLALTRISYATLVIVPAAAAAHAKRTVRAAQVYFRALGAEPHSVMVVDEESAGAGDKAVSLENTDAVYLTDGSPLDCVQALRGSSVLRTLVRSWDRGAVLAACGASAMALGPHFWDGAGWSEGLGLVPNAVVIPHFQLVAGRYTYERLSRDLPPTPGGARPIMIGIDDSTGVVVDASGRARVVGAGIVTILSAGEAHEYEPGQWLEGTRIL